jgi:chromosome transmission fidelity protein 18
LLCLLNAGYNIREMNASDDRSVEIFRKVIDDVTQSKSEIFQDGRPNCLVIDEIDGAPAVRDFVFLNLSSC